MSDGLDNLSDLLGDEPGQAPAPKGGGLRAQLEAVLAERQALKEQLNSLQTAQRQRDLGELFSKHQIPELARDFFPKDGELSDDTARSFVEKYGSLWGHVAPAAATPPAEQVAQAAMASVAGQAAPPPLAPMSREDYSAKFAEAKSMSELNAIMQQLGVLG